MATGYRRTLVEPIWRRTARTEKQIPLVIPRPVRKPPYPVHKSVKATTSIGLNIEDGPHPSRTGHFLEFMNKTLNLPAMGFQGQEANRKCVQIGRLTRRYESAQRALQRQHCGLIDEEQAPVLASRSPPICYGNRILLARTSCAGAGRQGYQTLQLSMAPQGLRTPRCMRTRRTQRIFPYLPRRFAPSRS